MIYVQLESDIYTRGNRPVAAEQPLKTVVKWASVSGEPPAAESRSCVLYFFSSRRGTTNDHLDSNLLLYQFHPSPIYRKRKTFGSKYDWCSDWSQAQTVDCLCRHPSGAAHRDRSSVNLLEEECDQRKTRNIHIHKKALVVSLLNISEKLSLFPLLRT